MVTDMCVKQNFASEMMKAFEKELEEESLPREEIDRKVERSRTRILSAPVIIILSVDMSEMDQYSDRRRKKREFIMATQSTANAGLQLLLAAHAEGLGGVWVCSPMFAQKTVQSALELPKSWEPQAMLLLGYPVEIPLVRERKTIKEIVKTFE